MPQEPESLSFPDALMLNDGGFTSAQGNLVQTNYVDLSGTLPMACVTLAKVSEPRFDLRTIGTIRLSRPSVFRTTGEVLVKDEQEGQARTETRHTVEEPEDGELDRRVRALRAGISLGHTKMSVKDATAKATRTNRTSAKVTFGEDWMIYSTSVWPEPDEEEAWRQTFPDGYTSVTRLHRPAQFALALGFAICEHVGVGGKPAPMTGTFHGFRTVKVERTSQMVLHGPVLYVDDPYRCIETAEEGWPQICSMIFVKSRAYAAQKEYRFATLSIRADLGEVVDVPVSGMMRDCLESVNAPLVGTDAQVAITEDTTETPGKRETSRSYRYRRRTVKRQTGNWGNEEGKGREKEEIVEETVTSPEEVPEPFPSEQKRPDVIIFHQVGSRYSFQHHAYWNEETVRWRIETLRENPAIVENPRLGKPPAGLEVPDDLRLNVVDAPPADPEFILDLCLNPRVPWPPVEYPPLKRFSASEVGHAMASYWSLAMAVSRVDGAEQEKAAASAWYAFRFVLDLVGSFGAIVKSVCVIEECVVVVDLERAPLTGAVAWATFSGTGTYTLYVDRGNVEELAFPGQFSRAGPISEATLVESLGENGWALKNAAERANKDHRCGGPNAWAERVRKARKWWHRTAPDMDRPDDGAWALRGWSYYRKWVSMMASDLKRARRGLGMGKANAAERAGLSVADYARIERGKVPKNREGFVKMMTVAKALGVRALRMEYLKPYRTHLGVELSADRPLMMFLELVSTDVSGSRAQGYYVSPYNVLRVVGDIGLETVLEGESAGDRALFSLWMTTILMQCRRASNESRYLRLVPESVDRTEILLVADVASAMVGTEEVQIARHNSSVGDICETMKELLERGRVEKRTVLVYASGNGHLEVAKLRKLMRAYKGQEAYLVTRTREANGVRVIPFGHLGSRGAERGGRKS